jgi:hypothetical protein
MPYCGFEMRERRMREYDETERRFSFTGGKGVGGIGAKIWSLLFNIDW